MLVYPLLFAEPHQQYFSQPNVQGPVYWNFELLSVCVCVFVTQGLVKVNCRLLSGYGAETSSGCRCLDLRTGEARMFGILGGCC